MPKSKSGKIIKSMIQAVIFVGLLFLGIFVRTYYLTLNQITVKEQLIKQTKEATVYLQGLSLPIAFDKWYSVLLSRLFLLFGIKDQVILYTAFLLFGFCYLILFSMVKKTIKRELAYLLCLYYIIDIIQIQNFCTFDSFVFMHTLLYGLLFLFVNISIWVNKKFQKDGLLLLSIFSSMIIAYGIKNYITNELIPILIILSLLIYFFKMLYAKMKQQQSVMEELSMAQSELASNEIKIENSNILSNEKPVLKESEKLDFPYHFEEKDLKYDFDDL